MRPPRGFADLAGRRVGLFGVGVEGEATRRRLDGVVDSVVLVDDRADQARHVLATNEGGLDALAQCDVVLKSPGIPRRRADVLALEASGVVVTSALCLWLCDADPHSVIAITGTKGKSTTTALATFALRSLGLDARAAGNIGAPPYDPDVADATFTVLEVSSYQAVDLRCGPAVVVVTSLGSDHLDWHGDQATYVADKLSLTRLDHDHVTLLGDDPALLAERAQIGGEIRVVGAADDALVRALSLRGAHNARNLELALTAAAIVTGEPVARVTDAVRTHAASFEPLPGRMATVRTAGPVTFIDDGLATAPLPTVAALDVVADEPVALLCGGFDRGVDYTSLVDALAARSLPTSVIAFGPAGARIAAACTERGVSVVTAQDMDDGVRRGFDVVRTGGVVLLSPAAPSFDHYDNWRERSFDFTRAVNALPIN